MDNVIIDASATATFTGLAVALFKSAWPAAPMWVLVLVSLACGIAIAFLVALAGNVVFVGPHIAQVVLVGLMAAAVAAGVARTDNAASKLRDAATAKPADPAPAVLRMPTPEESQP
jgi:hypothetical protein